MEQNNSGFIKSAMTYGAILGAVLVVYSILLYITGIDVYDPKGSGQYLNYINYAILFVGIFICQKKYRDNYLNGYIPYAKSLGFGVLLGAFASIITTFYSLMFFKFIDPSVLDYIFDLTEQNMIDSGVPNSEIDKAMEMARKFTLPGMILGGLFVYAFISFIFSLITSIFVKQEDDPFKSSMKEIES